MRAIIVDDERLARESMRLLLAAHPGVEVVGEADSVTTAAELVERLEPEVVFLDIQMPGESGFELFDRVSRPFKTIFVTAYDEFALRAFEVNALDYLLKPVSRARLAAAIGRLSALPEGGEVAGEGLAESARVPDARTPRALEADDHLFITSDKWAGFVRVTDIACVTAMGQYSEIVTIGGRTALVLKSMKEWEERLPGRLFVRVHRSAIINVTCVERVDRLFNASLEVHLRQVKEPVLVSRRYAARLKTHFG